MSRIELDDKTLAALAKTESGVVAVTDAAGNVVGFYAPVKQEYAEEYAQMAARAHSVWGEIGPPPGPLTTPEVIERMKLLEKSK